jgi:hypothetical protein
MNAQPEEPRPSEFCVRPPGGFDALPSPRTVLVLCVLFAAGMTALYFAKRWPWCLIPAGIFLAPCAVLFCHEAASEATKRDLRKLYSDGDTSDERRPSHSDSAWVVPIVSALVFAGSAHAEPPGVSQIFPAGGQRGTVVEFRVGGFYLHGHAGFEMIGGGVQAVPEVNAVENFWIEGPMILKPDSQGKEDFPKDHAGRVTIAPDAAPGVRHWNCRTSQGSTPTMKFVIGDLPEVIEHEIEGAPIPEQVKLPVTINGRIFPREDVDLWTFHAEHGQTISCSIDSRSLGYPLEAVLEIIAPDGRTVRDVRRQTDVSGDPTSVFTARVAGDYTVKVNDAGFAGGPHFVYRLTVQAGPRLESIFPLGGRRGETVKFLVNGTRTVVLPLKLAAGHALIQRVEDLGMAALHVDDLPEVRESDSAGTAFTLPAMLNGVIARAGEVDVWNVELKKGQPLSLEVLAAQLGSKLDSVLTISEAGGAEVARNDDRVPGQADAALSFTAPKDAAYQVRVSDRFATRGGPAFGYRLRATLADQPDFELTLTGDMVNLTRQTEAEAAESDPKKRPAAKTPPFRLTMTPTGGFAKDVKLEAIGLPEGVTLETPLISAKQKVVDLRFVAPPRTKIQVANVIIRGTAELDGKTLTHDATFPTAFGEPPADHIRLAVAPPVPFRHIGEYWVTNDQPSGTTMSKHFELQRDGFDGPLTVSLADRQGRCLQGLTGQPMVVPAGATDFTYNVLFPPDLELGRTNRVQLMLVGEITDFDGSRHTVSYTSFEQNEQIISVVTEGQLRLTTSNTSYPVVPGGRVTVPFTLRRNAGVTNRPLRVELKVPAHISGVSAQPALLAGDANEGTLTIEYGPRPGPFNMPLTVFAQTADNQEPPHHAAARIELVPSAVAAK